MYLVCKARGVSSIVILRAHQMPIHPSNIRPGKEKRLALKRKPCTNKSPMLLETSLFNIVVFQISVIEIT